MAEWFKDWFGAEYATLYAHRDQHEADEQVDFLLSILNAASSKRNESFNTEDTVLDIACGAARHLSAMGTRGLSCIGIDLSMELLQLSDPKTSAPLLLAQADMRSLPFANKSFGGITNFFTSFGYLDDDQAHIDLLREWRRVAKDNAFLLMDFLNREAVISNLKPFSSKKINGLNVIESRRISEDGKRVLKDIEISAEAEDTETKSYQESDRLYNKTEIELMLKEAGFELLSQFGDFSGNEWQSTSPRLISFAQATPY